MISVLAKPVADQLALASYWGFNSNILETNLINLAVVLGILVYFGKRVCAN